MHEIREKSGLRARVHVETELDVELTGVHAEGDGRENDDPGSALPCKPRRLSRDPITLDRVGPVRQVIVVRFGRAPREHRNLERGALYSLPGGFVEDVWAGRHGGGGL
jgi:hypothetical protein